MARNKGHELHGGFFSSHQHKWYLWCVTLQSSRFNSEGSVKPGLDDDMFVIAGDNALDFSLTKCGVVEIDENDCIVSVDKKPAQPKLYWCCPPFYYYT